MLVIPEGVGDSEGWGVAFIGLFLNGCHCWFHSQHGVESGCSIWFTSCKGVDRNPGYVCGLVLGFV